MKNINKLTPIQAIIFNNKENNQLILTEGKEIVVTTDNTDFEKYYSGAITFLTTDGLEVENLDFIHWEYIIEIKEL